MSLTRRDWLKSAVGTPALLALAPAVPPILSRAAVAAEAARERNDNMLVVLQLSGGNDGLNTIVPHADDAYGRNRSTLRLAERELHKIDDSLGFHPEFAAVSKLYQEGYASVIQGVGYAKGNRDHEAAMRDWHTARPGEAACQTGWIGRAIDLAAGSGEPAVPGIFVGPIATPFALHAEQQVVPAIRALDASQRQMLQRLHGQSLRWRQLADWEATGDASPAGGSPLLDAVSRNLQAAYVGGERLEAVLDRADGAAGYPPFQLAGHLTAIAQLMRADLGIRIFFAELGGGGIGGFDNHANQRDNHAALLRQLSESVAAFVRDVQRAKLLDRVAVMTFSEFGRTLVENGRRGTDHGDAAPVLVFGGRLRGGLVGPHPNLQRLVGDAPESHTDFRRVYATMLDRWLGLDSRKVLGQRYEPLHVFA
ncbi:MAG TPA: DUF1501 domain-containing protein [Candidatus Anammoximicrobium sp.]|nr:DUF1501 domain-containing protein [Candidatus Anammoximicrobium sp.]